MVLELPISGPGELILAAEQKHFLPTIPSFAGRGLRVLHPIQRHGCEWVSSSVGASYACVRLCVPGSKSYTNRAAVLAGMLNVPVKLSGVLFSDDSFWAFESLCRLGFTVELRPEEGQVLIVPPDQAYLLSHFTAQNLLPKMLYFGLAGTLARFFPAVVLNYAYTFKHIWNDSLSLSVLAVGEQRLCQRPLSELTNALRDLNANIQGTSLPIVLANSRLQGNCKISGSKSGQFLSGLLLAAAGAGREICIERIDNLVQPDYVRMTLKAIAHFGVCVEHDSQLQHFRVVAKQKLFADSYAVEADASTACYFLAAAALLNIELVVENLGSSSLQPDIEFLYFLEKMGVPIEISDCYLKVLPRDFVELQDINGVPVFLPADKSHAPDLSAEQRVPRPLKGGFVADFSKCSDQALTAAMVAITAHQPIEIRGIAHIRGHESDRIGCLVENFKSLGVDFVEWPDGFRTVPVTKCLEGPWPTHNDHRFAMCGFLLGLMHPGIEILDPGCVAKTAPNFFTLMERLGASYR